LQREIGKHGNEGQSKRLVTIKRRKKRRIVIRRKKQKRLSQKRQDDDNGRPNTNEKNRQPQHKPKTHWLTLADARKIIKTQSGLARLI